MRFSSASGAELVGLDVERDYAINGVVSVFGVSDRRVGEVRSLTFFALITGPRSDDAPSVSLAPQQV